MMLSKLFNAANPALRRAWPAPGRMPRCLAPALLAPGLRGPAPALRAPVRSFFGLVPPDQYENNVIPNKFRPGFALFHHWEIIPLYVCFAFYGFCVLLLALYNGVSNKVDIQFSGHEWNCISRNMDLRNPTVHKNITYFQRYEPWPDMQDVLDKMKQAEHRLQTRVDTCGKS